MRRQDERNEGQIMKDGEEETILGHFRGCYKNHLAFVFP